MCPIVVLILQGRGFVGCPHAAGFSGLKHCFFLQCSSHGWAHSSSSYSAPFSFGYHFEQFLKATLRLQLFLIYLLMFLFRYTIDGLLLQGLAEHRLLLRFIHNAALGLGSDSPGVAALWVSFLPHPAECGTSRFSLLRLERVL